MFGKLKKLNLQDLEKNFNIKAYQLGNLYIQLHRIEKEINKAVQEMETLSKRGVKIKEKIGAEIQQKVKEGTPAQETTDENETEAAA